MRLFQITDSGICEVCDQIIDLVTVADTERTTMWLHRPPNPADFHEAVPV